MSFYFAAPISETLADEVAATIDRVRSAERPEEHSAEGVELILRLTEACLHSYFVVPVSRMNVGGFAEKATSIGVKAAHRAIAVFVPRIAGNMSAEQVLDLADQLESMLLETEP